MNRRLIFKSIGSVLRIEALLMLFPLVVSLIYGGGDYWAFLWSILITSPRHVAKHKAKERNFRTRTLLSLPGYRGLLSLFGALPFYSRGVSTAL